MRRPCFCLVLSFCLGFSLLTQAQTRIVPATITLGQSIVALNGPWKFHIEDNPQWSDPNFDDSRWEAADLTPKTGAFDPVTGLAEYVPGWTAKGHPGYWGYAWYRLRVRVRTRPGQELALVGPADVDDAYQVFANGALLGSFGKFPAAGKQPVVYSTRPRMFRLPKMATGGGSGSDAATATQVLAFRVWMEPSTLTLTPDAGGLKSAPLLGEAAAVDAHYKLAWLDLIRGYISEPIEGVLFLLLAIVACSLILFDRSDPVYLWLAGVFLLIAAETAALAIGVWTQAESGRTLFLIYGVFLQPLLLGGWVMVWWFWFRLRRPAWVPKAIFALTLLYAISDALGEDLFFTAVPYTVGVVSHLASVCIRLLFLLLLALILVWGIRRQKLEGWLALPAVVLVGISQFQNELGVLHVRMDWFPFGAQVSLSQFASTALVAAMFALLLRRMLLSVEYQREMALDVKQAAEVQRVFIPETLPQVPGLAIESEYRPAREVGGDFFQILPHASDGSVLIILGDVTGKGLQAGMLVALIVGAIRAEAAHSSDPLTALNALNQRLYGRGHAHATCLALRIDTDGSATLANAGHLAPYLNGKELPMEGALPLGMIDGAEFTAMQFQMQEGDSLILMSDGVVEARDAHGHLFGFDRVAELLQHSATAAQLATAAQNFGQEDDILVLRIQVLRILYSASCTPHPGTPHPAHNTEPRIPSLQPALSSLPAVDELT